MSATESEEDYNNLTDAVRLVKEVIAAVDNKVNEHEKKRRLKEFHSRMDGKSIMMTKSGQIFAREDLLRRRLIHDGALQLKNSQGRLKGEEMRFFLCKLWKCVNVFQTSFLSTHNYFYSVGSTDVHALLLSDVFVFLQEKDQKYVFAMLVGSCCSINSFLSPHPPPPLSLLPCAAPSMFSPSLQSLQ